MQRRGINIARTLRDNGSRGAKPVPTTAPLQPSSGTTISRDEVRPTRPGLAPRLTAAPLQPSSGTTISRAAKPVLVGLPAALVAFSYFGTGDSLLWIGAAVLAAIILLGETAPLLLPDWAVVLMLLYEVPSLIFSRYASNGLLSVRTETGTA